MERLSPEQIEPRLAGLPNWTLVGDALQRTISFKDFAAAMVFVNRVAELAEQRNHHPDILVRYNKVTLTLSTHDAGGITEKDLELAQACEGAR